MIERSHPFLSVGAQCRLLSISRSSFYYEPQGETEVNLALMKLIDKQFLETPFYGVQQMTWHMRNEGHAVNVKRVRRLMRLMRLMPIFQKPDTSRPAKGHKTYPYLLGGLRVDRPNQVWCADITYLHAWETGSQAKAGVGRWITFYNHQRPHAAHGGQPPAVVYFNSIETDQQVQAVA